MDVDLEAAVVGAVDDFEFARAQYEGVQDVESGFDLIDGAGREGYADGVADAVVEEDAEGVGGFDGALEAGSGFGDAEVEELVAASANSR